MQKMQAQSHNMEPFVSRMRHNWAHVEPAGTQAGADGATRCLNGGPFGRQMCECGTQFDTQGTAMEARGAQMEAQVSQSRPEGSIMDHVSV